MLKSLHKQWNLFGLRQHLSRDISPFLPDAYPCKPICCKRVSFIKLRIDDILASLVNESPLARFIIADSNSSQPTYENEYCIKLRIDDILASLVDISPLTCFVIANAYSCYVVHKVIGNIKLRIYKVFSSLVNESPLASCWITCAYRYQSTSEFI